MTYRETTIMITDIRSSVTDGTINMIQSANESVKKQLIDRYCGRLSTWEASWFNVLKEGQIILEAHEAHGYWFSPAPIFPALTCVPDNSTGSVSENTPDKGSDSASDSLNRSVSAVNKVLERYNLTRKRRLN